MKVERSKLLDLRAEWEALLPRSTKRSVFMTWGFLATWWEHLARGREERTYVVRDAAGQVVAIVPLYRQVRATKLGRARILRNIGFGDLANPDFLDALVLPGRALDVADALEPVLFEERDWDYAEFSEVEDGAALLAMAARWRERRDLEQVVELRARCPFITLPRRYDDYLAACNPHFRQQIRRYRRVIERELAPQWKLVGRDVTVDEGMRMLADLHQDRMEATLRGGNFRREEYARFQEALAHRLHDAGDLWFWILFLEGRPAASHYGFLHDGVYYGYQMGFAVQYAKYSPGHYMTGVVMERLIEAGAREMNFLRGTDPWKFRWTERTRRTVTATLLPAGLGARLARARVGLDQSAPLALRYVMGREAFDEIRAAWLKLASTFTS